MEVTTFLPKLSDHFADKEKISLGCKITHSADEITIRWKKKFISQ